MTVAKTLLILTPGFPADEADTTCLPPQQIFIKALNKKYPELNIIILSFDYPFLKTTYRWHGNTIISFNGWKKAKISRILMLISIWRKLKRLKKENAIVGLLSFWFGECALIGRYFGKLYSIKQYTWILGQDAKKGNKYVRIIRPVDTNLIAISDFIAEEFCKNYKIRPLHIIPVGIDTSMFGSKIAKRNIDIMGAGSLIPLKQYTLFIEIIKELSPHFPDIHAIICGKGEEKERLQALINELSLQNHITLMGEVPHSEVVHLMQQSNIFLHTSSYEGFSTVCNEALYAGCNVLSFCRAMRNEIEKWHIMNSKEEMITEVIEILNNNKTQHNPVLIFPLEKTVTSIMKLFGY